MEVAAIGFTIRKRFSNCCKLVFEMFTLPTKLSIEHNFLPKKLRTEGVQGIGISTRRQSHEKCARYFYKLT